jgi:sulfate permease, SulP family
MIADTVAMMAYGDPQRYAHIASLAGGMAALLCLIAWLLRLSVLVRLISDSILVGFEAGAGVEGTGRVYFLRGLAAVLRSG